MTEHRLSRKEIKHDIQDDAFRHGMAESVHYVAGHRNLLLGILAGIALLIAVVFGVRAWMASQAREASEMLGRAERALAAPIVTSGAQPDHPTSPTFADEASRTGKAKEILEQLRAEHGSSAAAAVATLYLGNLRHQAGDVAGARQLWEEFLDDHDDHLIAAGVRVSLIMLNRRDGKDQEVADRLRAAIESDDKELPEDVLLFELGKTLEQLGQAEEARGVYQRLGDEYPDSPYASQAQNKARELGPQEQAAPEIQLPS